MEKNLRDNNLDFLKEFKGVVVLSNKSSQYTGVYIDGKRFDWIESINIHSIRGSFPVKATLDIWVDKVILSMDKESTFLNILDKKIPLKAFLKFLDPYGEWDGNGNELMKEEKKEV